MGQPRGYDVAARPWDVGDSAVLWRSLCKAADSTAREAGMWQRSERQAQLTKRRSCIQEFAVTCETLRPHFAVGERRGAERARRQERQRRHVDRLNVPRRSRFPSARRTRMRATASSRTLLTSHDPAQRWGDVGGGQPRHWRHRSQFAGRRPERDGRHERDCRESISLPRAQAVCSFRGMMATIGRRPVPG